MADVRKRPLEDDQDLRVSKKRAVSSATDSPVPVNGNMATAYEDPNEVYLEVYLILFVCQNGTESNTSEISQGSHLSENAAIFQRERASTRADRDARTTARYTAGKYGSY